MGTVLLNSGQVLVGVHDPSQCEGEFCVIHNPSDHHMKDWPLIFRRDRGIMERICPHGIGHDDPDDLEYRLRMGEDPKHAGVHGCDGCCKNTTKEGIVK